MKNDSKALRNIVLISQEKLKKDKAQQDEIDRKVEEYRKRQEKDSSEIKR